jgi:photosystem II stability/assembly factor-like uncharacterized protein
MKKIILFTLLLIGSFSYAQKSDLDKLLNDINFRNIGPAFMSGRIADIAIHPDNPHIWYVAVGSGGVWKTENSGTSWQPVFDSQKSFSIGCVAIDPNNPHRIWVGTGENVGGRHAGFGDGVYLSTDDGKSWKNMGLKKSEHISKIIIYPGNSDIIYVAAQGPLWSKGGERGFYKSTDGGKTWKKTLGDDQWTGVTDIAIDPRNPDRIYAATWERHRTVANYMGGGKNTAIYRSENGGETWKKIMKGIPEGKNGKIGIAVSPLKPDIIYAAIEHNRRHGAVYKSTDRGESWTKQSNTVSGATGPHYYQELYASPHEFDKIYLANVRMLVSENGGKDFYQMSEKYKHSDNHVLVFRKDDPNYMLVGTDGGIYESFDKGKNWRFINNLPVTQFYKLALDDSKPFYYIYGGTQDNSTQRGPSQTDNSSGIANRDWEVVLFADGHQPATEPGNPDIAYAEWQEGSLTRIDVKTGERTFIQPQPKAGEPFERFNWDAPILISPHNPKRLYYGSYRVWRSDNRGDDWQAVSGDLTNYEERFDKPIMGKKQSWDSPWDVYAMSTFNTITSLAESPVQEGLLYAGTDDGNIQVSGNSGKTWQKIPVDKLPGVPKNAFVNDIKADKFDANTVYVCLDNHKEGDYKPYLYKSTDKGKTWKKITSNLPEPLLIWRLVQDYKNPDLLFIGTEFGIYTSLNGGKKWHKLNTKANISFRDLAIKEGEDDLVGASFGRGFFILDDYSFLRQISDNQMDKKATLFKPVDSWWYIPRDMFGHGGKGSQGEAYYLAPNPPYGTTFTYYLKNSYQSLTEKRQKKEKEMEKTGADINFPGWETLDKEKNEIKPEIFLNIVDENGEIINRLPLKNKKGYHRITWNHTRFSIKPVQSHHTHPRFETGVKVAPGIYKAFVNKLLPDGSLQTLTDTVSFNVKPLHRPYLKGKPLQEVAGFWKKLDEFNARLNLLQKNVSNKQNSIERIYQTILKSAENKQDILKKIINLKKKIVEINTEIHGSPSKNEVGEKITPTVFNRLSAVRQGVQYSSYGPTEAHLKTFDLAQKEYQKLSEKMQQIDKDLQQIKSMMKELNIPFLDNSCE